MNSSGSNNVSLKYEGYAEYASFGCWDFGNYKIGICNKNSIPLWLVWYSFVVKLVALVIFCLVWSNYVVI